MVDFSESLLTEPRNVTLVPLVMIFTLFAPDESPLVPTTAL